ncbi:MAG: hydroxymethylglutaryl-CoA lyase [Pseudomonadota bacterium]|jgi:hydroxymethylglutaryl-CoA lyase|nr:hydroxymethylglutaryl-CoA lyase [Pseudomonadota bacterium]
MSASSEIDVLVSEVGPRDGLQSIKSVLPTAAKKAWIAAEAAAGVREIEVCSFVPAKLMPQMADAAEIVAYARTIPGLTVLALVPNFKGAENAINAGAHKIALPLSASETHSKANLRKSHADVIEDVRRIAELLRSLPANRRPGFEGNIATAFGCTLEGVVPERKVVELAVALMEAGCEDIGLSDTTGYANPAQLRRLIRLVRAAVGRDKLSSVHLHNTRGLGLANALAALEEGITTLDSSLGGLGGCPHAPGASGNIVTEDLVFMLDAMGLRTGIDLRKLLEVRQILRENLPDDELYGFTPDAGLPKGYAPGGWGIA